MAVQPSGEMYDTILVPTDGNPGMNAVARQALDLAALAGAEVHVLSVVDPTRVRSDADDEEVESLERTASDATDRIATMAAQRDQDVTTVVRTGRPYEEILDYADDAGADLIVMGTHGRAGLDRYLLGSVAERVVRAATVPVLTVNLTEHGDAIRDAETAIALATEAIENEGHHVESVPDDPYRESNTWIVRVESQDGSRFNVHVNAGTRETRVARVG